MNKANHIIQNKSEEISNTNMWVKPTTILFQLIELEEQKLPSYGSLFFKIGLICQLQIMAEVH